jgi:transposase InsO family protein
MPWNSNTIMSLRKEFVHMALKPATNIRQLCWRYSISPKTGYKWIGRFRNNDPVGLADHSRRPLNSPNKTPDAIEQLVVSVRIKHPAWCGRKIRHYLLRKDHDNIPAASTITRILHRHNLIRPSSEQPPYKWHRFEHAAPNDLWQMDFKGHFKVGIQQCHPLTIIDDHSRYAIGLTACTNQKERTVKDVLISRFIRYGLPWRINVDNGPPWGDDRETPFTRLTMWLIRNGVNVSHSRPFHPQTNGKDERFHRTIGVEVLQGRAFKDFYNVQRAFDEWLPIYNYERPHEAINNAVPADRYYPSTREFSEILPPIEYGQNDIVRKVDINGRISFKSRRFRIGKCVRNQHIAIRPTHVDGRYDVYYCTQKIKTIDLRMQSEITITCPPLEEDK